MTQEQIQKIKKKKYPLPPIEGWQPDYDVYKNDREKWVEGYKAAMLQNKGEWISDAVEFAEWIINNRYLFDFKKKKYVAAWNNYQELTSKELYEEFTSTQTVTK